MIQSVQVKRADAIARRDDYAQALETFISNQRSDCTKATYWSNIKQFGIWIDKPIEEIHVGDVVAYKAHLEGRELAPATIAHKLTSLRQFFRFLRDHGVLERDPTAGVKLPRVANETNKSVLSLADAQAMLRQIDTSIILGLRDKAIIALMLVCGLREIEIVRACVKDLHTANEFDVLAVRGKGGKVIDVPLRPDVKDLIGDYLAARGDVDGDDALFIGHNGRAGARMTTRTIRAMIDRRLAALGLKRPGISAHSLRHTAVTHTAQAGATILQLQDFARHSDPKVTVRYVHRLSRLKDHGVHINPIRA